MTPDDAERPRRTRRRATSPQGVPRTPSRDAVQEASQAPPQAMLQAMSSTTSSDPVRKPRHKAQARAAAAASATTDPDHAEPTPPRRPRDNRAKDNRARDTRAKDTRARGADRGLQDLVGGGPSQLGPDRAMRARDVNRPTAADLATAERTLDIVHRNWRPQ